MQIKKEERENKASSIENLKEETAVLYEKGCALTRAELRQVIAGKRDKLYHSMQILSIVFAVVSAGVMAGFKVNEGFFDASSRIGILMESINAQKSDLLAPKVNVRTSYKDENKSRLVMPLTEPIAIEDIRIQEEFVQNKYVITLTKYSANMPNGIELVSDSTIMDAVGVYRQNDDVVVEIYCRDLYDYELAIDGDTLTVIFKEMANSYVASAVVWIPYEDRNRLALPEWKQSFDKFATDNHIKLYMAPTMQEKYTQEEVVLFANRIHADMVLGVQVDKTGEQQSYMTGVCNTMYFIPDYNSAHLAVVMAEAFAEATQIGIRGFEEGDSRQALVLEATVPSALVRISLTQRDMEGVENEYRLNGKIVEALERTMEVILQDYVKMEEATDEN